MLQAKIEVATATDKSVPERVAFGDALTTAVAIGLLVAASVMTPLGGILVPFIPIPFARFALRYGQQRLVTAAIGLFVGTIVLAFTSDLSVTSGLTFAMTLTWLGAGVAYAVVLGSKGQRFAQHPLAVLTIAFMGFPVVVAAGILVTAGPDKVKDEGAIVGERLAESVGRAGDDLEKQCEKKDANEALCSGRQYNESLDALRAAEKRFAQDPALVLFPTLVALAFAYAGMTRWLSWFVSRRSGLIAPAKLRSLQIPWTFGWLLAAALVAIVIGVEAPSVAALAIGLSLTVLAVLGLLALGVGTMSHIFWARRVGAIWRGIFWVGCIVFTYTALLLVLLIGLADFIVGIRRRVRRREGGNTKTPSES